MVRKGFIKRRLSSILEHEVDVGQQLKSGRLTVVLPRKLLRSLVQPEHGYEWVAERVVWLKSGWGPCFWRVPAKEFRIYYILGSGQH